MTDARSSTAVLELEQGSSLEEAQRDRRKAALVELEGAKENLGAAQKMLELADIEPAVRAVMARLDLRTLVFVCGLERLSVSERPFEWCEELWVEIRGHAAAIIARARVELADDPDVQTICQASEIAEDCLEAIGVS
jgi:hypothetical protein